MTTQTSKPSTREPDQRDALEEAERKASEGHPRSFDDKAIDEKIVEIPPVDKDGQPIKGLDPK